MMNEHLSHIYQNLMKIDFRGCGEIVEIVSLGDGSNLVMIDFTWRIPSFRYSCKNKLL